MEQYCGFNIPEKIIIVSKPVKKYCRDTGDWEATGEQQGYVVASDGKSSLEGAMNWAGAEWHYVDNKQVYKDYDKYVHEYENGHFGLRIVDSADQSSQGGKLSFWTCEITAPDGQKYLIGINSDLLCDFILENTFINGKAEANVYLGKQKTRTGIFTENMETFRQSKSDAEMRARKSSVKYEPGQKVYSKTDHKVYLGEMYRRCELIYVRENSWNRYYAFVIYDKPQKVYAYGMYEYTYDDDWHRQYNFNKLGDADVADKKKPYYFNEGEVMKIDAPYKEFIKCKTIELNESLNRNKNRFEDPEDCQRLNKRDIAEIEFVKACYSNDNYKLEVTDELKEIFNHYMNDYIADIYYLKETPNYKIITSVDKEKLERENASCEVR